MVNTAYFQISEVGEQLSVYNEALIFHGRRLHTMGYIFQIVLRQRGKENITDVFLLIQEGTLILFGFTLRLKISLADMLFFAGLIREVEVGIPAGSSSECVE